MKTLDNRASVTSGRRDEPLRLGVVGCGAVTERYHLPALALGGGLVLGELWRRRMALRWTAGALVSAALAQGALLWVQRLITYR